MVLLSLDLSTHCSGYAIGTEDKIQLYNCFTSSSKSTIARMIQMRENIKNLLKQNPQIEKIVIQEVPPQYNSHTMKVLMWLQAVIAVAAYEVNPKIQLVFMNASEWRAALKIKQGKGIRREQLKNKDIQYVKNKYNIEIENDDIADAICLFDAYWLKYNNELNW